jgi:hypothetical protein
VRLRFLEIDEYLEGTYQRGSQGRSERREMTQMCEGWEKQRGRLVGLRDQGQLLARLAGSTVYWGECGLDWRFRHRWAEGLYCLN